MRLHWSLSHYICPQDLGLRDFLDLACAQGFRGVALTVRALQEIEPVRLKAELQARGLAISSVNSAGYFLHTGEAATEQLARNQWLIESCVALDAAPLNVIVGGLGHAQGALSLQAARDQARRQFTAFAQQAAQAGVPLLFEPIHPMGMWLKGCVHSLKESLSFLEGLPGTGITLDCYHSWWDSDLMGFIAQEGSPLALLQVCDVGPQGEDALPCRLPPGEGILDLAAIVGACQRRKRPPQLELELFAAQLQGRPLHDVLQAATGHLAALEASLP